MTESFTSGDLVTAHLPDGGKAEGNYWSHPRCPDAYVIDWTPRKRRPGAMFADQTHRFVKIIPGTVVHAMSVRPCHLSPIHAAAVSA